MTFFKNVPDNLPVEPERVSPGKHVTCIDHGASLSAAAAQSSLVPPGERCAPDIDVGSSTPPARTPRAGTTLHSSSASAVEPELLTVHDVAAILRQSPTTVYRLVDRRAIRYLRFPHGLRFRRSDIDAYLASVVVEVVNYNHL